MSITVERIADAFLGLFGNLHREELTKKLPFKKWDKDTLLPWVRSFLMTYFCESLMKIPVSFEGHGDIDFLIGDFAVEFAVRNPAAEETLLLASDYSSEIEKLMKYGGVSLLVLFDFSERPYTEQEIERFRDWPPLYDRGRGISLFCVAYFYVEGYIAGHGAICSKQVVRVC